MPTHVPRASRPAKAVGAAAVAALALTLVPAPAGAAPADTWPLLVTEIAPDNTGYDDFEYVEIHNPTGQDVVLGEGGYRLAYTYADSDDRTRDVPLSVPAGTVVPAGATVVLWLQYTAGNVDTTQFDAADFRAFWAERGGSAAEYPVVPLSGQPGMANGGNRGIRVLDASGAEVTRSHVPSGGAGADQVVQFRTPVGADQRSTDVLATLAAPTPGVVDPAQLEDRSAEPTPDPEPTTEPTPDPTPSATPTPTPSTTPTAQPTPGTVPGPAADSLVGLLQVTELVVDSTNVGGADGYEFVELYNSTTEPIPFEDHVIRYLYPNADYTNSNTALWPATPADAVVAPGETLVLWVKNGGNTDLTRADFRAFWGVDLPDARILEMQVGGMANGSPRGIEVMTRTGHTVNRAYYNMGGARDVATDQGIHYGVDPADFSWQRLLRTSAATPGSVSADQVPTTLTTPVADTRAPRIEDGAPDVVDPTVPLTFAADVSDDRQVKRVELWVRSDLDAAERMVPVQDDGSGGYATSIPPVDLIGKSSYTYRWVASDGTHVTRTEPVTLPVLGANADPVRLNVEDGDVLAGTAPVSVHTSTGDPADLVLAVDGTPLTPTAPQLEKEAVFAVEVTATDNNFRNGIVLPSPTGDACHDGEVLTIFERGTYGNVETVTASVPLAAVRPGEPLSLLVSAGTKAAPCIDLEENNDNFTISSPRLVLPDGRTLTPAGYTGGNIGMGDSGAGNVDDYRATFTLPDDAFSAVGHAWDTTTVADGTHTVTGTDGVRTDTAEVVVDNTAPVVEPSLVADETSDAGLQGRITLDAVVTDAASSVAEVTATLDGEPVTLPHTTSSRLLVPGEHHLAVTATDVAGNTTTERRTFVTPDETPAVELLTPQDGAEVRGAAVELSARVSDPTGDALTVSFHEAFHFDATDAAVTASSGTTRDAAAATRDGADLTADQRAALTVLDGEGVRTEGGDALPYQLFDVAVPAEAGTDAQVHATWDGAAESGATVVLHAWDAAAGAWTEVDRHVGTGDGSAQESFTLTADVPVTGFVTDGTARFLVQHSEGWAGANLSDRSTAVTPAHPEDTPREQFDFTLGWESDTQYYNETWYDHQLAIHEYFLDRRDELNLQYVFHTGDIVDERDQAYQWENADAAYRMLDEAGLPYGVLAGNHDVGNFDSDYSTYSRFFGEARYAGNPWYGASYQDNRGHYDLFTAGGIDFVVVSMGWGPGDAEIAWMNETLAKFPNRVAIINLHEYLLPSMGLGPVPQRIQDEVVATNPNVTMVMSGHYHDASTRIDRFDDDGDGTAERVVTQMLFDYQGLPEGGQGFLRLMHFDNEAQQIQVRTYSPSLEVYNSDHETLDPQSQEFAISYADAGIVVRDKVLVGDAFSAEVRTNAEVGAAETVTPVAASTSPLAAAAPFAGAPALMAVPVLPGAAGSVVSVDWTPADGTHGWYVRVVDEHGAAVESEVRTVAFTRVVDGGGDGGAGGGDGTGGAGTGGTGGGTGAGSGTGAGTGSAAGTGRGGSGALAVTGADAGALALLGALLVAAGGAAVLARRRLTAG
ncbi:metallophosphoesterase [Cellulomonas sp.]|uniref:metallophosphoesterase n=1 Tax=Cellulomonas sp. TaxID=40001 RepID=UPI002810DB8A|nr:metallophosphoesterase [Cellulomonas sp.]